MCYSSMVRQDLKYLEQLFDAEVLEEAFEEYYKLSAQDSRTYKSLPENPRIFPYYFAPVVAGVAGSNQIMPMRYQVWPNSFGTDPKNLSLFNARRDNLKSKIWSQLIGRHHGILVIDAFYEWVAVKDVVAAGVVSLEQVKQEFQRQSDERKKRIELQGKKISSNQNRANRPHV